MVSKAGEIANEYLDETTIHGFLEIKEFRGVAKKTLWAIIMTVVAIICTLLLFELTIDIINEPRVTTIADIQLREEPTLLLYPGSMKDTYKNPGEPVDMNHFANLLTEYGLANIECNTFFIYMDESNECIDLFSEVLEPVEEVRIGLQREVLAVELFSTSELLIGPPSFVTPKKYVQDQLKTNFKVKNIKNGLQVQELVRNDSFIADLVELMGILHLDSYVGEEAQNLYKSLIPAVFADAITHDRTPTPTPGKDVRAYVGSDPSTTQPEQVHTRFGLGFRIKLGVSPDVNQVLEGAERVSDNFVVINCAILGVDTIRWGIGSGYDFLDQLPSDSVPCETKTTVEFNVRKTTYDKRYCNETLKPENPNSTSCMTDCFLRKARQSRSCLPYLGVPQLRSDIPFCSTKKVAALKDYRVGDKVNCVDECRERKFWRPCFSLEMRDPQILAGQPRINYLYTQVNAFLEPNVAELEIRIFLDSRESISLHVGPKYTFSNIVSSVGGIVGIGFGISLMSLMQLLLYCCKMSKFLAVEAKRSIK